MTRELPNDLTKDIDISTSISLVRLLGSVDAALFSGWGGLPGIFSEEMIASSLALVRSISGALGHPAGRVVFSGCGTSGRLAHLISRGLNTWLDRIPTPGLPGRFDYIIAGTDAALLLPQEGAEDDPESGKRDLEQWAHTSGVDVSRAPVVLVGISCGLSATCECRDARRPLTVSVCARYRCRIDAPSCASASGVCRSRRGI